MKWLEVFSTELGKNFVLVKNKNGTSDRECSCSTWITHWEFHSVQQAIKCSNMACNQDAVDGSHVIKCEMSEKSEYIVPLCHECNMQKDTEFHVLGDDLIPANAKPCKN